MKLYVVIVKDRHSDIAVQLFEDEQQAINTARLTAAGLARWPEDLNEEMTQGMRNLGWVYHNTYSCEGDSVTVLAREVHGSAGEGT